MATNSQRNISPTQSDNCIQEKNLLQRIGESNNLTDILNQLNRYLEHNDPCINIPITREHGGDIHTCGGVGCEDSLMGDSNGDGVRNILDVVDTVGYIIDSEMNPISGGDCGLACADMNRDGIINILDVVGLISGILNGEWPDDDNGTDGDSNEGCVWPPACNYNPNATFACDGTPLDEINFLTWNNNAIYAECCIYAGADDNPFSSYVLDCWADFSNTDDFCHTTGPFPIPFCGSDSTSTITNCTELSEFYLSIGATDSYSDTYAEGCSVEGCFDENACNPQACPDGYECIDNGMCIYAVPFEGEGLIGEPFSPSTGMACDCDSIGPNGLAWDCEGNCSDFASAFVGIDDCGMCLGQNAIQDCHGNCPNCGTDEEYGGAPCVGDAGMYLGPDGGGLDECGVCGGSYLEEDCDFEIYGIHNVLQYVEEDTPTEVYFDCIVDALANEDIITITVVNPSLGSFSNDPTVYESCGQDCVRAIKTYTPPLNFSSQDPQDGYQLDTIHFYCNENTIQTGPFITNIQVLERNDIPTVQNLFPNTLEDNSVDLTLACDDSLDPDGSYPREWTFYLESGPFNGTLDIAIGEEGCEGSAQDETDPLYEGCGYGYQNHNNGGIGYRTITYTPNLNYSGTDTFTYRCSTRNYNDYDTISMSNVGTATITIGAVDDAPITSDETINLFQHQIISVELSCSDAEGENITYEIVGASPEEYGYAFIEYESNVLVYHADYRFSGIQTVEYSCSDGTNESYGMITFNVMEVIKPSLPLNDMLLSEYIIDPEELTEPIPLPCSVGTYAPTHYAIFYQDLGDAINNGIMEFKDMHGNIMNLTDMINPTTNTYNDVGSYPNYFEIPTGFNADDNIESISAIGDSLGFSNGAQQFPFLTLTYAAEPDFFGSEKLSYTCYTKDPWFHWEDGAHGMQENAWHAWIPTVPDMDYIDVYLYGLDHFLYTSTQDLQLNSPNVGFVEWKEVVLNTTYSESSAEFGIPGVSIFPSLDKLFDPYSGIDMRQQFQHTCSHLEFMLGTETAGVVGDGIWYKPEDFAIALGTFPYTNLAGNWPEGLYYTSAPGQWNEWTGISLSELPIPLDMSIFNCEYDFSRPPQFQTPPLGYSFNDLDNDGIQDPGEEIDEGGIPTFYIPSYQPTSQIRARCIDGSYVYMACSDAGECDILSPTNTLDIAVGEAGMGVDFNLYGLDTPVYTGIEACARILPLSSMLNTREYFDLDNDKRPSLGLFYYKEDNLQSENLTKNITDFKQINLPNLLDNPNGRKIEEVHSSRDRLDWTNRWGTGAGASNVIHWAPGASTSGWPHSSYNQDYLDVLYGQEVWKQANGTYCYADGAQNTPADCIGSFTPAGGWHHLNMKAVPPSWGGYGFMSHTYLSDHMYAGRDGYFSPSHMDFTDVTDDMLDGGRMPFALWTHSSECRSYNRCLAFTNFSGAQDVDCPGRFQHPGNNGGTCQPYYATQNQYQTFYRPTESDASGPDNFIRPYSSLKISFYLKTTRWEYPDSIDMATGDPHKPSVEVAIVPHNGAYFDGYENTWPIPPFYGDDESLTASSMNQNNNAYYSAYGDNNSGDYQELEGQHFWAAGSHRFSNTQLDVWEKFEFTFSLTEQHVFDDGKVKPLHFVVQHGNNVKGTMYLDEFEVKESYSFIPDVDVRKRKGADDYGIGSLTEYYDPKLEEEKYNDTLAPLEAAFYFYPRYNIENPFDDADIIYNDFRSGYFYLYDIDWGDGSAKEFTTEPKQIGNNVTTLHTYEKSGIFEVTGYMLRIKPDDDGEILGIIHNRKFTLRININEDRDDDFQYFGSNGFSFIPYKNTSPIIGGYSPESVYFKSIKRQAGFITDDLKVSPKFDKISDKMKTEVALIKMDDSYAENLDIIPEFQIPRYQDTTNQQLIWTGDYYSNNLSEFGEGLGNVDITNVRFYNDPLSIAASLGSFQLPIAGCTDESACNWNPEATMDDGTCEYPDCAGVCDGDAEEDMCEICDGGSFCDTMVEEENCFNGEWFQTHVIEYEDPNEPDLILGTCFGGVVDCNCECYGDAYIDGCGVCDGDNSTCTDCAGILNGGSRILHFCFDGDCDDLPCPHECQQFCTSDVPPDNCEGDEGYDDKLQNGRWIQVHFECAKYPGLDNEEIIDISLFCELYMPIEATWNEEYLICEDEMGYDISEEICYSLRPTCDITQQQCESFVYEVPNEDGSVNAFTGVWDEETEICMPQDPMDAEHYEYLNYTALCDFYYPPNEFRLDSNQVADEDCTCEYNFRDCNNRCCDPGVEFDEDYGSNNYLGTCVCDTFNPELPYDPENIEETDPQYCDASSHYFDGGWADVDPEWYNSTAFETYNCASCPRLACGHLEGCNNCKWIESDCHEMDSCNVCDGYNLCVGCTNPDACNYNKRKEFRFSSSKGAYWEYYDCETADGTNVCTIDDGDTCIFPHDIYNPDNCSGNTHFCCPKDATGEFIEFSNSLQFEDYDSCSTTCQDQFVCEFPDEFGIYHHCDGPDDLEGCLILNLGSCINNPDYDVTCGCDEGFTCLNCLCCEFVNDEYGILQEVNCPDCCIESPGSLGNLGVENGGLGPGLDCHGICGGTGVLDECGICDGDNSLCDDGLFTCVNNMGCGGEATLIGPYGLVTDLPMNTNYCDVCALDVINSDAMFGEMCVNNAFDLIEQSWLNPDIPNYITCNADYTPCLCNGMCAAANACFCNGDDADDPDCWDGGGLTHLLPPGSGPALYAMYAQLGRIPCCGMTVDGHIAPVDYPFCQTCGTAMEEVYNNCVADVFGHPYDCEEPPPSGLLDAECMSSWCRGLIGPVSSTSCMDQYCINFIGEPFIDPDISGSGSGDCDCSWESKQYGWDQEDTAEGCCPNGACNCAGSCSNTWYKDACGNCVSQYACYAGYTCACESNNGCYWFDGCGNLPQGTWDGSCGDDCNENSDDPAEPWCGYHGDAAESPGAQPPGPYATQCSNAFNACDVHYPPEATNMHAFGGGRCDYVGTFFSCGNCGDFEYACYEPQYWPGYGQYNPYNNCSPYACETHDGLAEPRSGTSTWHGPGQFHCWGGGTWPLCSTSDTAQPNSWDNTSNQGYHIHGCTGGCSGYASYSATFAYNGGMNGFCCSESSYNPPCQPSSYMTSYREYWSAQESGMIPPVVQSGNSYRTEDEELREVGNPGHPRYWKNIIPKDTKLTDRHGIVVNNNTGEISINANSEQVWIGTHNFNNSSEWPYYYPVLPRWDKFGKLWYVDYAGYQGYNYQNNNIPYAQTGAITEEGVGRERLKFELSVQQVENNILDDFSGYQNYGFYFTDYKPEFSNQTLEPQKIRNTKKVNISKLDGAF